MPKYRVRPGRTFFYGCLYGEGEAGGPVVDYPGPPGAALVLEPGETPWPEPYQQGCEPVAGGSAPTEGADAPAVDLAARLDRARTDVPTVEFGGGMTAADVQRQDREREDATQARFGGQGDHDHDGKVGGDAGGMTKAEIIKLLTERNVEIPARANKDELLKLLAESAVPAPTQEESKTSEP